MPYFYYRCYRICVLLLLTLSVCLATTLQVHAKRPSINLTPEEQAYLESHGPVVFISQNSYPPFEFLHEDNIQDGMMIELAHWIATEAGFRTQFVNTTFLEAQNAVHEGRADIITSLFFSKKRDRDFDFSQVIFDVPASIFVRADRLDINKLQDLTGKRIAIQRGDYAKDFLERNNIIFELIATDDFAEAIKAVDIGDADAIIGDEQIVLYTLYKDGLTDRVKKIGEPLYTGHNCMAVRGGNRVLLSILDKGLDHARQSGIFEKLNRKWIGSPIPEASGYWQRLWPYLLLFVSGLLAVGIWNFRLRYSVTIKDKALLESEFRYRELYERLRSREQRLQYALKGANCGLWDWDIVNQELYFDTNYYRMAGYLPHDFPANYDEWRKRVHPEDLPAAEAAIQNYLGGRISHYSIEFRMLARDGSWLWILDQGEIIERAADGSPLRFIGLHIDISERTRAEQEVELSNKRLLTILDSIDASIYVADLETYEVLFMNRYMIDEYGQDLTGRLCWQVFRHEEGPCAFCSNLLLRDAQGQSTGIHSWHDYNPITGKHYVNHDRAIEWTDGRMVRIQIASDITELRKMEEQLRRKYKMEAVGLMAGGIAHNFNNNLAIILGNVELAGLKSPAGSEIEEHLDNAKIAVLRSRDLVQQIMTYSRQGIQKQAPVQLPLIVEETLKLLKSTMPTTIELTFRPTADDRDLTILADSTRIQEALLNLCTNAVHAMKERGELTISLSTRTLQSAEASEETGRRAGRYACLSVKDNGCGMPPEILEKAFDPFFTTKDVDQGTGMGLSTVQGIIDQHQGFISVVSNPGKGSDFQLYFPLITSVPSEESKQHSDLPRGRERILFVDDDEMLADLGGIMLTEMGYLTTVETSSQRALERLTSAPDDFDLLITDQTMPGLTGLDLIQQAHAALPELPVILCSGHSSKISKKDANRLRISALCQKPLEMTELLQAIRAALEEKIT